MIAGGIAAALLCGSSPFARAQEIPMAVAEVYNLIRTNLSGLSASEIESHAVTGIVAAFGPRVRLVTSAEPAKTNAAILKTRVYDGEIAYLRVGRIGPEFAEDVKSSYEAVLKTNRVDGMVIDLRYAKGDDYAAAAQTADLFLREEKPLLDWGAGVRKSTAKDQSIRVPVAILVNEQTAAAAEALAAMMRQTGTALLLGSKTSGQAVISKEFKLLSGGSLAIAVAPVKFGDGTSLPIQGLQPDILVNVPAEAQSVWYADPFAILSAAGTRLTGTNVARRSRFGEAELVRGRRDGFGSELEPPISGGLEPEKPVLRDPVLARALDVLKGLALVRPGRS
jgi:hypothetical protein